MTIEIRADEPKSLPLIFKTDKGAPVTGPTGGVVTVSGEPIAGAAIAEDGQSILVTPVGSTGSVTITYENGPLTASAEVTLVAPPAASVEIGAPAA